MRENKNSRKKPWSIQLTRDVQHFTHQLEILLKAAKPRLLVGKATTRSVAFFASRLLLSKLGSEGGNCCKIFVFLNRSLRLSVPSCSFKVCRSRPLRLISLEAGHKLEQVSEQVQLKLLRRFFGPADADAVAAAV